MAALAVAPPVLARVVARLAQAQVALPVQVAPLAQVIPLARLLAPLGVAPIRCCAKTLAAPISYRLGCHTVLARGVRRAIALPTVCSPTRHPVTIVTAG